MLVEYSWYVLLTSNVGFHQLLDISNKLQPMEFVIYLFWVLVLQLIRNETIAPSLRCVAESKSLAIGLYVDETDASRDIDRPKAPSMIHGSVFPHSYLSMTTILTSGLGKYYSFIC